MPCGFIESFLKHCQRRNWFCFLRSFTSQDVENKIAEGRLAALLVFDSLPPRNPCQLQGCGGGGNSGQSQLRSVDQFCSNLLRTVLIRTIIFQLKHLGSWNQAGLASKPGFINCTITDQILSLSFWSFFFFFNFTYKTRAIITHL